MKVHQYRPTTEQDTRTESLAQSARRVDGSLHYHNPVRSTQPSMAPVNRSGRLGPPEGLEETDISTRPRLTPDQVALLESHFQANFKPSGQIKRQLAQVTGLTLPRVSVSTSTSFSAT